MIAGSRKPRITRWYIDSDGQRLGPYTLGHLQTEFRAGRVRADAQALPVNDDGEVEGRVMTVRQLLDSYLDPAVSLFETLRAAKDKRTPQKKLGTIADLMPTEASPRSLFPKIPDQAWLFGGLVVVTGLLIFVSIAFVKQSSQLLTHEKETVQNRQASKEVPPKDAPPIAQTPRIPATVRPTATSRPLLAPVVPAPAPLPKRVVTRPLPVAVPIPARRDDRDSEDRDRYDRRDDLPIDRDLAAPRDRANPGDQIRNPANNSFGGEQNLDNRNARDPGSNDPEATPIDPNNVRDNARDPLPGSDQFVAPSQ